MAYGSARWAPAELPARSLRPDQHRTAERTVLRGHFSQSIDLDAVHVRRRHEIVDVAREEDRVDVDRGTATSARSPGSSSEERVHAAVLPERDLPVSTHRRGESAHR